MMEFDVRKGILTGVNHIGYFYSTCICSGHFNSIIPFPQCDEENYVPSEKNTLFLELMEKVEVVN